ncbi:AMP-binding protein [uncultured Fibrobacter sp.]|uniref:AMP-binding protein n=1 Tax=uncultured Fibrobacter sp. TaxID=261512 RepID=UPI002616E56D|nr:AMP-binding protein [uncultured Fibrobacter sp.]
MKTVAGKVVFATFSVLYPALVFCGLEFWGLSPRRLSLLLIGLAFVHFFNVTRGRSGERKGGNFDRTNVVKGLALVALMLLCGGLAFFADNIMFLKFYPVMVSLSLLSFFAFSLWKKPSFVFRLANLGDKTLRTSPERFFVERYCDRVTLVWCIFFILNASIAFATALVGSDRIWSLYNGLISYILIGILFAVEFMVRKMMQKKMHSYIPVCDLQRDSRPEGSVVCFDGENVRTWAEFVGDVSKVRRFLESSENRPWILHCEDSYFFIVALLSMLQSGRKAMVTANRQEAFIREIKKPEYGFITDTPFGDASAGAVQIQDILNGPAVETLWNSFDKNDAQMVMFTSGTTGEPKSVPKRFSQFENELFELVKVFGDDWVGRKVYSTVNHHHIYGLLFTVLLPTATGLPFRRHRIDYPSELTSLAAEKAVIASSPAYLKRLAADTDKPIDFKCTPIIYSSGGPLPEEVARKCEGITGYWTTEIYGSTETGGIAYRQSKNGPIWKPFEVCKMSIGENDCLNVKSSYILEPEGFTTGDLVEIYEDGRFLLKGRADSIVKIEEKRISLPEVENRLKQTGLVQDVRVVPMVGSRQYLAAAIVLNAEGCEKFKGLPKLEINNFFKKHLMQFIENTVSPKKWRYLEELPQDTQGKIKMRDIQALFGIPESPNFKILKMHREPGAVKLKLVFPETSDFYSGHFPTFKLLPAVAQVDMAVMFGHALLGTSQTVQRIQRTKFSYPILPGVPAILEMTYKAETAKLAFSYTLEEGRALSGGTLVMTEATDA